MKFTWAKSWDFVPGNLTLANCLSRQCTVVTNEIAPMAMILTDFCFIGQYRGQMNYSTINELSIKIIQLNYS